MAVTEATRTRPPLHRTRPTEQPYEDVAPDRSFMAEVGVSPDRTLLSEGVGTRLRVYAAMATWFTGIFALIYVAAPLAMATVGWTGAIGSLFPNAVAMLLTAAGIFTVLESTRPEMVLHRNLDPVLPVAAGSFAAWAWLHNSVGFLRPFADFGTAELATFMALNGLEFTLFGMIFATFVRTRMGGFILGFGFQVAYIAAFALGLALF